MEEYTFYKVYSANRSHISIPLRFKNEPALLGKFSKSYFNSFKMQMRRGASLFRIGVDPLRQSRSKRTGHDDLVAPEDAEMQFKETMNFDPQVVTSSFNSRNKYGSGGYGSSDKTDSKGSSANSGTNSNNNSKTDSKGSSGDNLSSGDRKPPPVKFTESLSSDQIKEDQKQSVIPKSLSSINVEKTQKPLKPPSNIPQKNLRTPSLQNTQPDNTKIPQKFIDPVIDRIAIPVRNRLSVSLPMHDLVVARTQAEISLNEAAENVNRLHQQTSRCADAVGDCYTHVRLLHGKAVQLAQTAELANGKLGVFDDWVGRLDGAGDNFKMQAIELAVKLISFISSFLILIWHSLVYVVMRPFRRRQPKKRFDVQTDPMEDTTEPGDEQTEDPTEGG